MSKNGTVIIFGCVCVVGAVGKISDYQVEGYTLGDLLSPFRL